MSIATDVVEGKITFGQGVSEAEQWVEKLVAGSPATQAAAGAALSSIKQGVSNAVALAGTDLGNLLIPAAKTIETTVDGLLSAATHGVSTPFNPFVNGGIDAAAAFLKNEIDLVVTKTKAALGTPAS